MRPFLVRKINNFTKTVSLCAKVPNTYGVRLYITRIGANPALAGCAQIRVIYTTPKNLEREKVF